MGVPYSYFGGFREFGNISDLSRSSLCGGVQLYVSLLSHDLYILEIMYLIIIASRRIATNDRDDSTPTPPQYII